MLQSSTEQLLCVAKIKTKSYSSTVIMLCYPMCLELNTIGYIRTLESYEEFKAMFKTYLFDQRVRECEGYKERERERERESEKERVRDR